MIKYIFPYKQVPVSSKIVIYGLGEVGIDYYKQMLATDYCDVVAIIDKKWEDYSGFECPVYPREKIAELEYDYIVLAFKTSTHIREILSALKELGVPERKIIKPIHKSVEITVNRSCTTENDSELFAYDISKMSISVMLRGGIGDSISNAPLIYLLIKEMPNCVIDLIGVPNKAFLKYLFCECKNINVITGRIVDEKNYTLSIDIVRGNVVVKQMKTEVLKTVSSSFLKKMQLIQDKNKLEDFDYSIPLHVFWRRFEFLNLDYYDAKTCGGILKLDKNVPVPLTESGKKEFDEFKLDKYITVCGGNGLSKDQSIVSKAWPKEYFEKLIEMIKAEYPELTIVQIGDVDSDEYKKVDRCYLGKEFEVVSWILKNSMRHIDIDGGMVHLASQLGTKCIVLFGPTSAKYLGYKENINILSDKCNSCYGLYSENYRCARFMDEPECMYSIRPEMVFEKVAGLIDDK